MDNVQNCDSCINIPSSQTYSPVITLDNKQDMLVGTGYRCSGQGHLSDDFISQWPLKFFKVGEYLEELNKHQFGRHVTYNKVCNLRKV
jgi:hypothetical protein